MLQPKDKIQVVSEGVLHSMNTSTDNLAEKADSEANCIYEEHSMSSSSEKPTSTVANEGERPSRQSTHTEESKSESVPSRTDQDEKEKAQMEVVNIFAVHAGSSSVKLTVAGEYITARIDSGAEITILSQKVYDRLKRKPAKVKEVAMQMADPSAGFTGFIIKPIDIKLGNKTYKERIYVAPIGDEMLLGHDLLHHWEPWMICVPILYW